MDTPCSKIGHVIQVYEAEAGRILKQRVIHNLSMNKNIQAVTQLMDMTMKRNATVLMRTRSFCRSINVRF